MAQTTLQVVNNNGSLNFDYSANYTSISAEHIIQSNGAYVCDIIGDIKIQNHEGNINMHTDIGVIAIDSTASLSNAIVISASNVNGGILNTAGNGGYNVITTNGDIDLLSQGENINIGVSAVGTPAGQQTQNVNIDSFNTLNMSSGDLYFVSSDVISFVSATGDIEFGTSTGGIPVIKFKDGNVLINQNSSNLDYQLDVAVSHDSNNHPGYNGIIVNTNKSNVASDLTLQTSNTLGDGTQGILSIGSFGSDNSYAIFQKYLAFQTGNVVIRLDGPSYSPNESYLGFGLDFSTHDVGKNIYWQTSQRLDTIVKLGTYLSAMSDTANVNVSGTYTGDNSRVYLLQIDSLSNPNTFSWSNNGGKSFQKQFVPIIISPSPITLDSGLEVIFTQTTGFYLNQQFTFQTKITAIVNTIISTPTQNAPETMYSLQPFYSYIKTTTPTDIVIKTNDHEKMRITGDGSIGIQKNIPQACLDLDSKYNKILLVNQVNAGYQINPSISHLTSGGYVIVWNAENTLAIGGTKFENYGQRYLSDGSLYSNNFKINVSTMTTQSFPSIAGNRVANSNHFIVAWSRLDTTADPALNLNKVYCQIYHNMVPISAYDIAIDSFNYSTSDQIYPRAAGLYNGNYVIVWNADDSGSGSGVYSVKGIIISDSDTVNIVVSKFQISAPTPPLTSPYNAIYAYVAGLPSDDTSVPNGFVVGYMTALDTLSNPNIRYTISVRIMNPNGTPYSNEIPITSITPGSYTYSNISDGLLSVAEINLHQVNSPLGNGGFIITFYRSYQADTTLYAIGDLVNGLTSGATAKISGLDPVSHEITLENVSNRFLVAEEIKIQSSVIGGNIIEKINAITYSPLSINTAIITLDTGSKNVVAYRFNSNFTSSNQLVWYSQVNTTELYTDLDRTSGNTELFEYKRPLSAISVDNYGSACITWSTGSIPSVYYQLFNISDGSFIGTEQRLTSQYDGLKQRDQVVSHLRSIEGNDYGFVISWDNQSLNLLDTGIYQQLIGYNHSILNLTDGNCNFIFNHQNQCGIGTNAPIANLHIQSQNTTAFNDPANPVSVIIQNTSKHIITNATATEGLQNISFLNGSSNVLTIIKCGNSLRYDDLYPLPGNLIGFYKFDETQGTQARDSSATSTYLQDTNPSSYGYINSSAILNNFDIENCWVSGLINNALLFDGNNNYLFIESTAANNLNIVLETYKQLTLALWVNIPSSSSIIINTTYDIVSNGGDLTTKSGTYYLGLYDNTSTGNLKPLFTISVKNIDNSIGNINLIGNSILNDDKWHYVCATVLVNNTTSICTLNLYVDGILDNTISAAGIITITEHNEIKTYIGAQNDIGTINYYRGYMDELRFYNTVLSADLILQLFNYGNPNAIPKGSLFLNPNNNISHNFGIILDDKGNINNLGSRPLPYTILSGELIACSSNTTVYGIGTYFTTELTIGDIITLGLPSVDNIPNYTVISIINDTLLALDLPGYGGPEQTKPYQSVLRRPSIYTFFDNGDNIKGHIDNYGNLMIGSTKPTTMLEISGESGNNNNIPQITLTNYSIDDTIYARETGINFRGYNTNQTINTQYPPINLGHIQVAHDGASNDNKGIMRFFTNNGTQENNVLSLTANGYIGIGNQNIPLAVIHVNNLEPNNDCTMVLQSNSNIAGIQNIGSIFDEKSTMYFIGTQSIEPSFNLNYTALSAISGSNDNNSSPKLPMGRLDLLTNNNQTGSGTGNGIESRMSITHTGKVGINILNPPNQFTAAPEIRNINNDINSIDSVVYNAGISTITLNNNIFPSANEGQTLLIGSTCIFGDATLTSATILSIASQNSFTVAGDYRIYDPNYILLNPNAYIYTIYIHYQGLNVSKTNGFIGINTTTMNSPLSIYGAISKSIITVSSNTTLNATHYTVLCDTTILNITITLPPANSCNGRMYIIKNIVAGSNIVSVNGNGANIDNSNIPYQIVNSYGVLNYNTFQSDGANWWIVG